MQKHLTQKRSDQFCGFPSRKNIFFKQKSCFGFFFQLQSFFYYIPIVLFRWSFSCSFQISKFGKWLIWNLQGSWCWGQVQASLWDGMSLQWSSVNWSTINCGVSGSSLDYWNNSWSSVVGDWSSDLNGSWCVIRRSDMDSWVAWVLGDWSVWDDWSVSIWPWVRWCIWPGWIRKHVALCANGEEG